MGENISPWHRREIQGEQRKATLESQLNSLGLSHEEYEIIRGDDRYMKIVGFALEAGMDFYEAQYYLVANAIEMSGPTGKTTIENQGMDFGGLSRLKRKMWNEAG
jgi:hypothetical protein